MYGVCCRLHLRWRPHYSCPRQVEGIGKDEPLSEEKLCPVLAMYRARDFDDAIAKADKLVGGGRRCCEQAGGVPAAVRWSWLGQRAMLTPL